MVITPQESTSRQDTSNNPNLEAALSYARRGIYVHPVHSMRDGVCSCGGPAVNPKCTPGKHPRLANGHRGATTDGATIRSWWTLWPDANIGVDAERSGLVVVGPDSPEWLRRFEEKGLPTTWAYETGGGEGHVQYLYRRPDECPTTRVCVSGQYDVMSEGNVVLAPGTHASGRPRRWISPPNGALPEAPDWAVAILVEKANRATAGDEPDDPDEPPVRLSPGDLRWWRGEVVKRKDDGAVDTSWTMHVIACGLARSGLSRRMIASAVRDRAQRFGFDKAENRADPDRYYRAVADKALATVAAEFGATGATGGAVFEVISFAEARNRPRPRWQVEGLLVQGTIATIYGPSGAGKTFVALDLAMRVALGRDFHGRRVVQAPVLYVACEDGEGVAHRIDGWCRHHGVSDAELAGTGGLITSSANLRDETQADALLAAMAGMQTPPALVVIDTLAWAMVGGDENKVQDVMLVMDAARRLGMAGATVLVVHHTGKRGDEERGSSALRAGSYTMAKVTPGGRGDLTLEIDKMKGAPPGEPMAFRLVQIETPPAEPAKEGTFVIPLDTTCVIVPATGATAAPTTLTPNERKLLRTLAEAFPAGETVSRARLLVACGVPETSFDRALTSLQEREHVTRGTGGKGYVLTDAGREAVGGTPAPPPHPHGAPTGVPTSTTTTPTPRRGGGVGVGAGGGAGGRGWVGNTEAFGAAIANTGGFASRVGAEAVRRASPPAGRGGRTGQGCAHCGAVIAEGAMYCAKHGGKATSGEESE